MKGRDRELWTARLLIGLVFIVNVQCALAFLIIPDRYQAGFELEGVPGSGIVRGLGILFLMWSVPYAVAVTNPRLQKTSLIEAIVMQSIGFAGETILFLSFPGSQIVIRETVGRFIVFDGIGLIFLLLALWLVKKVSPDMAKIPTEGI